MNLTKVVILIYFLIFNINTLNAQIKNDYELTVRIAIEANLGWELYKQKIFVGKFKDGKYTDTNKEHKGYEFWSNGEYAKLDSDHNGHHETIFLIKNEQLIYVGSIGSRGTFINVSKKYHNLLNKSITKLRTKY